MVFGAHGKKFRDAAQQYHKSRTDLKQPKQNKFKYIYRNQQKQQEKELQQQKSELSQSAGQAQDLWNKHMQANTAIAQKFRLLSQDYKLDFQQEFMDDVAEALRNNSDVNHAIQNLLKNYSNITENL